MKGESISGILFSPDPSFQKEGNGIRSPTRNPDEPYILIPLIPLDQSRGTYTMLAFRKKVGAGTVSILLPFKEARESPYESPPQRSGHGSPLLARRRIQVRKSVDDRAGTVSRLKGEKSEGGCEASFLAGETSGLTNLNPSLS